jgi:hypothetical protein
MYEEFDLLLEPRRRAKPRSKWVRAGLADDRRLDRDFTCIHCRNFVSTHPLLSGVNHRNHCPYCLYSRHLDLLEPGDRLAACKARMRPVGLALKRSKKKYAGLGRGELLLVHLCEDCGKVSLNRMATDDDAGLVFEVYNRSFALDEVARRKLQKSGVEILQDEDVHLVQAQLFGLTACKTF